ncbi:MAG: exodeoxyribonuclease VII small subunit [Actinomyces sp.]|nr:MAG: exodeoxyribonuclease VII small subunit [Actinomyces sp.]
MNDPHDAAAEPGTVGSGTDDGDVASLGYAEALAELEDILDELERDDVDVDILTRRVERAAALIAHCRSRIDAARVTVERVVAGLGAPTPDDGAGPDAPVLPLEEGGAEP